MALGFTIIVDSDKECPFNESGSVTMVQPCHGVQIKHSGETVEAEYLEFTNELSFCDNLDDFSVFKRNAVYLRDMCKAIVRERRDCLDLWTCKRQEKPENITDESSDKEVIKSLEWGMIRNYFDELNQGVLYNPFFGMLTFYRIDQYGAIEEHIKSRCSSRFYELYRDLTGTCASIRSLNNIMESIHSNVSCNLNDSGIVSIYEWALNTWDLCPPEINTVDYVKPDFMVRLYKEVNQETLGFYNDRLCKARDIAKSLMIQLDAEPLDESYRMILEGYLNLI